MLYKVNGRNSPQLHVRLLEKGPTQSPYRPASRKTQKNEDMAEALQDLFLERKKEVPVQQVAYGISVLQPY